MASFQTIEAPSESCVREKMSRFLAFAHPVRTADEAKALVKKYQNEYHDARHVCWAYMLGPARSEYQLNDNGEPSGTAGKPILGQINSAGLTDIVIIVVRYFGGIKLGTPGLTAAYREAAKEAIGNASIITLHEMQQANVTFPYVSMNDVMKIAKRDDVRIVQQTFDNTCRIVLEFQKESADEILGRLLAIDGTSLADA